MALTFRRWIVLAGLTGTAVAVALLPVAPREAGRRFIPPESSRLQRLNGQLNRARDNLKMIQVNDEVIATIERRPLTAGTVPTVLELGAVSAEQRLIFTDALHKWWPEELNDSIAVGIILGGDSADMVWQAHYLFPADTDGRTCIVLVPSQTWNRIQQISESELQRRLAGELGPCLFFGMFGRPGPALERWIGERGFDFSTYFNPSRRSIPAEGSLMEADPAEYVLFELEWSLYGTMPLGVKCLNGEIAECASAVVSRDAGVRPARRGFRAPAMPWRAPFGSLTRSYLSDLHRGIGPEGFQRFWATTLPVDEAIREATGKEVGEWTHQWLVGRGKVFRPGPLPEQRSVARVAGLTVLLLGVAIVYGVRRTVISR